jgi:hypothetical protein
VKAWSLWEAVKRSGKGEGQALSLVYSAIAWFPATTGCRKEGSRATAPPGEDESFFRRKKDITPASKYFFSNLKNMNLPE